MDEEDDDDDDEDSPLFMFGEIKMDQKKTDQKKKFSRGSVQLPNTAPKEKKDSQMLPVSESVIMKMSKEENSRPEQPPIYDWQHHTLAHISLGYSIFT